MRVRFIIAAMVSATLSAASASATVLISGDNGGKMEDYVVRFQKVRQSGEPVVIDGTCLSACTMVLGLVPRERICATRNAVLGFHAAWEFDRSGARVPSPTGTRELMRTYPSAVRAWIARHGGLTPRMKFVLGRELAGIVPRCGDASRSASASPPPRGGVRRTRSDQSERSSFGAR